MLPLLLALGCTSPRTEVVLIVDSDLAVPSELDAISVSMQSEDGQVREASAVLGAGQPALPRTLGLVHEAGPLGPYAVTIDGLSSGIRQVQRVAVFDFQEDQTLSLYVFLSRECTTTSCGIGQTCDRGSCRPVELGPGDLLPYDPDACRPTLELCGTGIDEDCDGSVDEAGPELCNGIDDDCDTIVDEGGSSEECNDVDDDCDGTVDEGFDTEIDTQNCGRCGRMCDFTNATGDCFAGECRVTSCDPGFGDCNSVGSDGCETDLSTSAAHCGMCNNACGPPERECCSSVCARSCI